MRGWLLTSHNATMSINATALAPAAKIQTPTTLQLALNPALLAAQTTVAPTRTMTAQAPAAVGKVDPTRTTQSSTNTAQTVDTLAEATLARAQRGSLINLKV